MKPIQEIYGFVQKINFYIQAEYPDWYKEFNDYKNSSSIDFALTDSFMLNRPIPFAAGTVIDILKMKNGQK